MVNMSKFYDFILKLLSGIGLTVSFMACSNKSADNSIIVNKPLNPITSKIIQEKDIYRLDVSQSNIAEALQNLAGRFEREFGKYYVAPAGSSEKIETINPFVSLSRPYIILRVEAVGTTDIPGVPLVEETAKPVGIVIRTSDLYIEGYIDNMDLNGDGATYYYYKDATTNQITGVPNRKQMNISTDYVAVSDSIDRISFLARLRDIREGRISDSTSRLMASIFSESVRFNTVRMQIINVLSKSAASGIFASVNFLPLWDTYFKNWRSLSKELYDYLKLPALSLDIKQIARLAYLRSTLFLGRFNARDLLGAAVSN
jgi:hypothetical protein